MKTIPLTKGLSALVDDLDYEFLMQWKWTAQRCDNRFYAVRRSRSGGKQVTFYMHRSLCNGITVDHKDLNTLNNQRSNLRPASQSQQSANSSLRVNNSSGMKGVYWEKQRNKWRALVHHCGERIDCGFFSDIKDAGRAYDRTAKRLFGDFALTNQDLGLV